MAFERFPRPANDSGLGFHYGTGTSDYSPERLCFWLDECARVMVDEARAFEARTLELVIFAVFGRDAYEAFSSALSSPEPEGW